MPLHEVILLWATIACYVIGTLLYMGAVFFRKRRWLSTPIVIIGNLFNLATMLSRSFTVGHIPVRTTYEMDLFGSWLCVGAFLLFQRRYRDIRLAGIVVLPFAFLMLGFGLLDTNDMSPLSPAYKNWWLPVHVLFAFISYSCFATSTGCSALYLLKGKNSGQNLYEKVPDLPVLEELSFKLAGFGFVANTIMLTSGALWAKDLWGNYWSWDPLETWSLIGWLVYGIFLHLRVTRGWREKKLAWLNVAALVIIFLSFWGVPYITPTYHTAQNIANILSSR